MDKELIVSSEASNDGKSIFLYFNEEVGYYAAFGLSAFLVSHIVDPVISYSPVFDLPVALINRYQILELRRALRKRGHVEHHYYNFELKRVIGKAGFDVWSEKAKDLLWTVR